MADSTDAQWLGTPEENGWPVRRAQPGELVADAIRRIRGILSGPFNLTHNDITMAIAVAVDPDEMEHRFKEARDAVRVRKVPLIGGPYDGRVSLPHGWPHGDVVLVGPDMARYESVRDPDSHTRLCFVHVPD